MFLHRAHKFGNGSPARRIVDTAQPDAVVMALVGHESAAMSARYTHVGKDALAKAAKTLPEL